MRKILALFMLAFSAEICYGQSLSQIKYWFDGHFGSAVIQTLSGVSSQISPSINCRGLNAGFHEVTIVVRDNAGKWSAPVTEAFYKIDTGSKKLVIFRYWLDGNYSSAVNQAVSAAFYQSSPIVNCRSLPSGFHEITMVTMDNSGKWSAPVTDAFYKVDTGIRQLKAYRYWFDGNYSNAVNQTFSSSYYQSSPIINCRSLPVGFHEITVTVQDDLGRWSAPITESYYRVDTSSRQLMAYRYWFNSDFGSKIDSVLAFPTSILQLNTTNLKVNALTLPYADSDTLHMQFKDDLGHWSVPTSDVFDRCGLMSSIVLDTLEHNPNGPLLISVMRGAVVHRYYALKSSTGIPLNNFPVTFVAKSDRVPGDSVLITVFSNKKGLVDFNINLGGNNPSETTDDIFQTSTGITIYPKSIGNYTCQGIFVNPENWLKTGITINPWEGYNGEVGLSLTGKVGKSGKFFSKAQPKIFRGLDASLSGGIEVTLRRSTQNTYEADLEGNIGLEAEASYGMRSNVFDLSLLSGEFKGNFSNKLIDYRINPKAFADWFWYYWYLMLSSIYPFNVSYNNLIEAAYSYARDHAGPEPVYHTETNFSIGLGFQAGPGFSEKITTKNTVDDNAWTFDLLNSNVGAAYKLSREWKGNSITTMLDGYSAEGTGDVAFSIFDSNIPGNHLSLGSKFTSSFRMGHEKNKEEKTETGTIELTSAGEVSSSGFSGELSISTRYTFHENSLNLLRDHIGKGLFNNSVAGYISGIGGTRNLWFRIGSLTGTEYDGLSARNYVAKHASPNWRRDELEITTEKTYTNEIGIDRTAKNLQDILKIGEVFELPIDLLVSSSITYPAFDYVYNFSMDSVLSLTEYHQTEALIKSYPGTIWDELSDGIWDWMKLNATSMLESFTSGLNSGARRVEEKVGSTIKSLGNKFRKINGSGVWKTTDTTLIQMVNISTLQFDVPGSDSAFTSNSDLTMCYYFPKGKLLSATNLGDTCVVISDIFFLDAKDPSGNVIMSAPNGKFKVTAELGSDDLKYFGFDSTETVSLLHRNYGDTVWEVLGNTSLKKPCSISIDQLGTFALGKVFGKDTFPPIITFETPVSSDTLYATITDRLSGVDWSKCFYIVDNISYPIKRIGLSNRVMLSNAGSTGGIHFVGISATDLQNNQDYQLMSVTTGIKGIPPVTRRLLMTVYPNPANETITLEIHDKINRPTQIRLFNAVGSQVYQSFIRSAANQIMQHKINISNLPAGLYYLSVENGELSEQEKVVIL